MFRDGKVGNITGEGKAGSSHGEAEGGHSCRAVVLTKCREREHMDMKNSPQKKKRRERQLQLRPGTPAVGCFPIARKRKAWLTCWEGY